VFSSGGKWVRKKKSGVDEKGRNWISDRLCVVDAVCHDGVVRRVYVPDGEYDKGNCYTTIDNITYSGDLSLVNVMTGHPTMGPFEFISIAEIDKLTKDQDDEWDSMSDEEQLAWNRKMNKAAEERNF
jgi:hypothetical protein